MSIGRMLWTASGYESAMNLQPVNISGKVQLQRYIPAPSAYNACACSVARSCSDLSWSGAQFLCYHGDNCERNTVVWRVPGFVKSCTTIDSLFASDLRCFFNKTCLDILLSMYNVDMSKRQSLPSAIVDVTMLNSSALSSFRLSDNIEKLASELMIDDWKIRTNYVGYYNSCAPDKCTYTITRRMNLFDVITMVTTFFGGLAVTFRLFIPICVRFLYWIFTYRRNHHSNITDHRSMKVLSGKCFFFYWRTKYKITSVEIL